MLLKTTQKALLAMCLSAGCSSPGEGGNMQGDSGRTSPGMSGDWMSIVEATWDLAPGATDTYFCATHTIEEDMYIGGFRDVSPTGTHHTVITLVDDDIEGTTRCGAGNLGEQMIYSSGVGTDPFVFPEGVALKLESGQTVHINVHTYNASDRPLENVTTALEVSLKSADSVEHQAEMVFAGTVRFRIPDDGTDYSASGSCEFKEEGTVLALWPHMHQLGRHMTISHEGHVLLDEPFNFEEQTSYPMEPVVVAAGESLDVTCTWKNDVGGGDVTFGDSSEQEMCFAGFFRYPATGASPFCDIPLL